VWLILDRDARRLAGAARDQLRTLQAAGLGPVDASQANDIIRRSQIVVDALIGYSLRGAPRGLAAELIALCNQHAERTLALDVPSGLDATTGQAPGAVIRPQRTLTLALPKAGLHSVPGELFLADIGIPPQVYDRLDIFFEPFFGQEYWIPLLAE
jgi:NAD(P)H-hydrate epimerase